jgi:hypothetical protein
VEVFDAATPGQKTRVDRGGHVEIKVAGDLMIEPAQEGYGTAEGSYSVLT